jgi:hypothetical protein
MKNSVLVFLVCLILQAVLIGKAVAYGEAVSQLERKIAGLSGENQELELLIASQISYSAIAQKAAQANLTPLAQAEPQAGHSVALKR